MPTGESGSQENKKGNVNLRRRNLKRDGEEDN